MRSPSGSSRTAGGRDTRGGRRSALRVSARRPRRSLCRTAGTRVAGLLDSGAVSEERCDVAVVGRRPRRRVPGLRAGLPGVQRDGHRRRPSGPGDRRRRGHPVAASPAWTPNRPLAVPPPCRRPLPGPAATDGRRRRGHRRAGYGRCGMLSLGLRPNEDEWFAPFAELVAPPLARRNHRDHARGGQLALPPARPGAPRPARAGFGAGRRPRHGRRATPGRGGARRCLRGRRGHGVLAGGRRRSPRARRGRRGRGPPERGLRSGCRRRWRLDRRHRRVAGHRLPVGPTKGQIVHLGVGAETEEWPIVQPLLTHYLVPVARGPGGLRWHVRGGRRVLRQRHRRGPPRAPARVPDAGARTGRRHLPRDPGGAAAHVGRRSCRGRAGCRAGATPGWRPDTAPTACCRGPTRVGPWRTPWPAVTCPPTSRRCRTVRPRPFRLRSPRSLIIHQGRRRAGTGPCAPENRPHCRGRCTRKVRCPRHDGERQAALTGTKPFWLDLDDAASTARCATS